jgi:fibronectin type 3 domain-containing protein
MKILQSAALSLFVMFASSFACSQNGPTAASVVLTWNQSTTAGVTANCVYRGTSSGQYKIPALFCSTAPITSYTDLSVQRGTTYFYAVTAQVGPTESGYSNEVSAMPIPVNPPSGNGSKTTKNVMPDSGAPILTARVVYR